jgi:hypothetical protein
MAVADVYRVKATCEGREGEWCMTWHYRELTPPSLNHATKQLAEGVADHLTPSLRAMLSLDHQVSRFKVDKLSGTKVPNSTFSLIAANRVGQMLGAALPAAAAIQGKVLQTAFSPKSNGHFWISGIPQDKVDGSVLDATYAITEVSNFLIELIANVPEPSAGDGLWGLIVLSRNWLKDNPGDYEGASADATLTGFDTRLGRMRSRRFGGRRRTKKVVEEEPPE